MSGIATGDGTGPNAPMSANEAAIDRRATRLADAVDRHSAVLYAGLALALLLLFVAAARLLTVEADEAWILLSTAYAFDAPVPVTDILGKPTVTTGGPYVLLQGLLARITTDIFVHRLVSLAAAGGLVWLVFRLLRGQDHSIGRAAAGAALFAAVPGFVLQAGLAMGEAIAVLFLIGAAAHWVHRGSHSYTAAIVTGLLLGTACATRLNCAAAAGGLLAYALASRGMNWVMLRRALLAVGVAGAVTILSAGSYYLKETAFLPGGQDGYLMAATGTGARKPLSNILQSLFMMNEYLPVLLILIVAGNWLAYRIRTDALIGNRHADVGGVLLFMGGAILGAWLLLAPIPHLRYLWPAAACLWLAGIIAALRVWSELRWAGARLAAHGVAAGVCVYALVATFFVVAHGESLTLVYRAIGTSPRSTLSTDQWFTAGRDQRELAAFVARQSPSTNIYSDYIQTAYPIVYLSGRRITTPRPGTEGAERLLVLLPSDRTIWQPIPAFRFWLNRSARLAFRSGDFVALRIPRGQPSPPLGTEQVGNIAAYR